MTDASVHLESAELAARRMFCKQARQVHICISVQRHIV